VWQRATATARGFVEVLGRQALGGQRQPVQQRGQGAVQGSGVVAGYLFIYYYYYYYYYFFFFFFLAVSSV
jgi:hypothetical protein